MIYILIILERSLVGLSPYSGENNSPKYGDFECHRLWMEVTHNLPYSMWYEDNQYMNISYWPLDYPPLCAYTHWGMSHIVKAV